MTQIMYAQLNTWIKIKNLKNKSKNKRITSDVLAQTKYMDCLSVSKKQDTTFGCQQETHITTKETQKLEVKCQKIMHQTCGNRKQAGAVIVINRQRRFKPKNSEKVKMVVHVNKENNPASRCHNPKYTYIKHQCLLDDEGNTSKLKQTDRTRCKGSGRA
jgi:hypothetical protein